MQTFVYPARLIPEKTDGGFNVRFDDFPEAFSCGGDRAEALALAPDCLEEAIAGRIVDGLEIPVPSPIRRGRAGITLPAPMAAKAALYVAIRESGLSNSELGRRMKLGEREIRRLLDPRHPTKLTRIKTILEFLGKRLVVTLENAA